MKYKKMILALFLFILFFNYIGHPILEKKMMKNYEDKLIRFHIRANSDKEEDQALKLKIRDKILDEMGERFGDTTSLEVSRNIIKENIEEMKHITEDVIAEEGEDYDVDITLGQDEFPTRRYGDLILPSGEYETLLITLGEGKGKNWWCVMFPPLCFVDITHSVAYNAAEVVESTVVDMKDEIVDEDKEYKINKENKKFEEDKTLDQDKEYKENKIHEQDKLIQEVEKNGQTEFNKDNKSNENDDLDKRYEQNKKQEKYEEIEEYKGYEQNENKQNNKPIENQQEIPKLKLKWKVVELYEKFKNR